MGQELRNDKDFIKEFKNYPSEFRVAAVIHDGQWYDPKKWAKMAYCKVQDVMQYIEENQDVLIENKGSYRVGYNEVINWYNENNLDIAKPLVPNNFIPKVWAGKTEVEHFINNPKKVVNTLLIMTDDKGLLNKIKTLLKGYAIFKENSKYDKLWVYTISTQYIIDYLKRQLTQNEFAQIKIRIRSNVEWRDVAEFDPVFLQEMLTFYLAYSRGLLKNHKTTIEMYIPYEEDRDAQIQEWVVNAIRKYNVNNSVPFSGYLNSVLQRWPYDLPNMELGTELASFQRERARARSKLVGKYEDETVDEEEIRVLTKYSKEDYYRLLEEHLDWLKFRNATPLNWDDQSQEKNGKPLFSSAFVKDPPKEFSNKLSYSLLKAAEQSGDYSSFCKVLESSKVDLESLDVGEQYKEILWEELNKK